MSKVLYRPFEDSDIESVAEMVREFWHSDSYIPSVEYARDEAKLELSHLLARSTFSQVAVVNEEPMGIVLARSERESNAALAHWGEIADELSHTLPEAEPEAYAHFRSWYDRELEVDAELLEQSDMPDKNEITLLVVSPRAHGFGMGTVLFDAASSYFAALGEQKVYLYTDTDCTWSFYERRGMKRMATYRARREERNLSLPRELYIYGMDLSA